MREEVWPVFLVVVDDRPLVSVGVLVAEEVLEILDPAVGPVVRDHPVGDVEVFGQGLVPEIERRDALVTSVVGVDVVVAGVPAVRGHVDPAIDLDLDRRPLAGPHVDRPHLGLVLESAPHFELGLAHGERDREAAVGQLAMLFWSEAVRRVMVVE